VRKAEHRATACAALNIDYRKGITCIRNGVVPFSAAMSHCAALSDTRIPYKNVSTEMMKSSASAVFRIPHPIVFAAGPCRSSRQSPVGELVLVRGTSNRLGHPRSNPRLLVGVVCAETP
jgi:hypothetical protein